MQHKGAQPFTRCHWPARPRAAGRGASDARYTNVYNLRAPINGSDHMPHITVYILQPHCIEISTRYSVFQTDDRTVQPTS